MALDYFQVIQHQTKYIIMMKRKDMNIRCEIIFHACCKSNPDLNKNEK